MPHSTHSSSRSVPCRLEWRPSRWLIAALCALGVLAAMSVIASEMPRWWALPLALAMLVYGAQLARLEASRALRSLVWPVDGSPVVLDGRAIDAVAVQWRGPLAFLRWRDADGRVMRLHWWPDTLPAALRRELRLAAQRHAASRPDASMAP
ncbi:MAG TPA: hypothetical protein VHF02_10520 [Luteimonas sp.]|nr:hypothetical protein [Luteimonas sp.]